MTLPAPDSRILIVYPYTGIDTNPTMALLLESLAKRKIRVDVLAPEGEGFLVPETFGETIHLERVPNSFFHQWFSIGGLPARIARNLVGSNGSCPTRFDHIFFGFFHAQRYSIIVGVDPWGISVADRLNRWAKKPLVYMSFEIMFGDEMVSTAERDLKQLELAACRRTSLVLIQDEERAEAFCRETSIADNKILMVPVAPPLQEVNRSDYLRKALKIPAGKRVVLYCGNLESWACRDELAETVSYWSEQYCLVVHNRSKVNQRMEHYLTRLAQTGKVYVSFDPVNRKEMADLVASADFGFAPYKPIPDNWMTGKNLYHLGLSSGKVGFYAMCGLPILARSLPVFEREFAKYGCGKTYNRMAEADTCLREMTQKYDSYSEESRRFYRERLNPSYAMNKFCDHLIDLR
jgi:hypothetical protein